MSVFDTMAALSALQVFEDVVKYMPAKIESSRIEKSIAKNNYVSRVELETKIDMIHSKSPSGIYRIIYGPKGVGKSEIIDYKSIGKSAIIKLVVTSANSIDDIVSALSRKILGTDKVGLTSELLIKAVEGCSIVPTIIFEVERGGSPDQSMGIQAVRTLAKLLSHTSRFIIILSEANTVLEFGQDNTREKFLFVDEFSHSEAKNLLNNLNLQFLTDAEVQYLFEKIGTNPSMLIELSESVPDEYSFKDFVDYKLSQARQDLIAFPHKEILKALKEDSTGLISPEFFNNKKSEGFDLSNPKAVGVAMKVSNAIVYRVELFAYSLMSTAHKTALKTYNPIVLV